MLWNQALARDPDDAVAHYQLARMAVRQRRASSRPGSDTSTASSRCAEDAGLGITVGAAYWRRGQVLEKLGRRDDAIAAYTDAVASQP